MWSAWPVHWWIDLLPQEVGERHVNFELFWILFLQLRKLAPSSRIVGCKWWLLWTKVVLGLTYIGIFKIWNFRCTPEHPCTHSEGHCTSDSDCERSGYHICGPACIGCWRYLELDLTISPLLRPGPTFDTRHYPNNTDIKYSSSDKCCVRRYKLFSLFYIKVFFFTGVPCHRQIKMRRDVWVLKSASMHHFLSPPKKTLLA